MQTLQVKLKHPRMDRVLTLIHGAAFYHPLIFLSFFLNIGDCLQEPRQEPQTPFHESVLFRADDFLFSISKH